MKKFRTLFVMLVFITGIVVQTSFAQLTGTKAIPSTNFPTIAVAIDSLNAVGVGTGGVTFNVAAGHTETSSNKIITATGTASNPIVFQKSGAGANPLITAGVGVSTTLDGVIIFSGSDYITFNGIDLQESSGNTTTTTQMEWGYALLKVDGTNGSQNITIRNCVITLNKTNTNSKGIYVANHTPASTSSLTVTAFSGTNSGNKFYNNIIQNCYIGMNLAGYSDATPFAYYDHFNEIGVQGGNTIKNFGGGSSTVYGIYTIYQDSLAVSNNNIGGGTGTTTTQYGIMISTATNASVLVYNNTVSDTTATTTSSTYGIALSNAGYTGTDNTVIVKRNTVQGMYGTALTSGALYGYYIYYTTAINLYVDSNKFINNKWGSGTTTATGSIYGMYIYPYTTTPVAGSVEYVTNNYLSGNNRKQSAIGGGTYYGMYIYYSQETVNVYNNLIDNDTLPSTGTSYGIYTYQTYATTANYYNNTVRNIYRPSGSAGIFYGIYIASSASSGTTNYYNNTVNNIVTSASTSNLYGQYVNSASITKNIYNNKVYGLWASSTANAYGFIQGSGTTINFYKNSIYDLRVSTGIIYGLYLVSGTTNNVYNNYISDLRADSSTNTLAISGIYIGGGTTNNLYYNTIYVNSVSTGATFGTAGIYVLTTPTLDLRNNIIVNKSTPGTAGGYTTAIYRSSTTLSTYAATSNYNCFYSGTPDTNRIIFYDGVTKCIDLSSYKGFVTPRDANSVSENPPFVNVSTTPYNLHINAATPTQCEGSGTIISSPIAIVDDFDGNARYPNSGYPVNPSYPPTAPDIGADEFGGIPVDMNPPNITYSPLLNTSSTTARTLVTVITDPSGVPTSGIGLPRLFWKKNSGLWDSTTASFGSGQYSFTFGGGVALGDTVSYYVVAQDNVVPPNVGTNPSSGAGNFSYNPPRAGTPPTTPSSYLISATALSGDYTVGTAMFNRITGKNITFQKVVNKVMKEVPIDERVKEQKVDKGKNTNIKDDNFTKDKISGKTKLIEVEEISWIPMENGQKYDGPLYIKKSESPQFAYPGNVMGIYATVTAAINDLNIRGVSGNTRFLLTDTAYSTETFPIIVNVANENKPGSSKTVTIKPNTGVTSIIYGAAPSSRIFAILNSYVTIDGSNAIGGTTRDLTIQNTSTSAPQVMVFGSLGTTPITNSGLINCKILNGANTSSAVVVSDGASPGSSGYFNNITIQNNSVGLAYMAFYCNAAIATGNGSGLNIIGNDLNSTTNPIRLVGVYAQGVDGATVNNNNIGNFAVADASNITGIWFATGTVNSTISGNTITNINGAATGAPRGIAISSAYANANINITGNTIAGILCGYSAPPYGLYIFSTTSGVSVKKNKISGLLNTSSSGYGARGINVATTVSPANIEIVNNFVWDVKATSDASLTYWGIGIAIDATINTVNVYFNSVNLYGTLAGYSSATVHTAFYLGSSVTLANIRDNIFVNSFDNTTSTTDKSYAIYCAGTNAAFTGINYCDYYVSGTPGILGYLGADRLTIADWKTATGRDTNSISGNPVFFNDSNLHIDSNQVSPVGNAGQFIATVLDDIDGKLRSTTTPDIGADEYTYQQGPLTGIKYIPGDYATIQAAITDLNTWGVGTGGVTFKVAAGKIDTAANLVINTTGTASNPIVFQKDGTDKLPNPVIIAGVGVGTLDGFIGLNGVDYITIDGIDLMENPANTTTTTQMEIGYALLKVDGTNGSQNNTIKNCSITLNKTNPSTVGIYAANHTISSTTTLTVTAVSGTNSNNKFYNNSIQNSYSGIYVTGFADASPYTFYDNGNDVGSLGGNTIRNFGGGATTTYGIYTTYQDSLAVSNNNVGGGTGTTTISYGIYIYYGYNANALIYNNTVSDTTAALTSTTYGIAVYYVGNTGVDNTVIVKRNTVQGMTNTAAATSAALYGYYIYYTTSFNLYIDSNKFINNKWGNTSGTFTGTIYPFYNYTYTTTPTTGSTEYITNNYIAGNKRTQSTIGTGSHYGMYNYYGLATVNVYNNIVENDTLTTTSTNYGIYTYHYYSTLVNMYNNIVRNNFKTDGSSGSYYGIYISNAAPTPGIFNFYNNSVYNIKAGIGAAPLYGMYISGTSATKNIYGNTVYNIQTTSGGAVYGLYQLNGTAVNIYKNKIYNLNTATGLGYGMYISSGTTNTIYNNYISDIRSDSSTNALGVAGLYISGGTTDNVYYNTIFLNSVSTGATFGSAGIYASTTPIVDMRNNIIVNTSTPGTTSGYTAAYQRSSTTLTTYADSSNRNCFYAGTPSAKRVIFYDGTNSDSTIALYKTRVAPKDANSFSENPPFVNVTTPPYDLHLLTTVPTMCANNAIPITGPVAITDDYDGNTRSTTTPDVGADEGDFMPPAVLTLNLKVYLEGFWNGTTQVTDTAKIYIANGTTPYSFVDSQKVVLSTAGTTTMNFNKSSGNYFIIVKHRNHLETWSRLPQAFVAGTPLSYDFTTDSAKAFGYNMIKVGSVWTLIGGDANQDGSVDALDVIVIMSQFGTQGYLAADFNGDGDVNGLDIALFVPDFGMTKVVPTLEVINPVIKVKDIDMKIPDKKKNKQNNNNNNNAINNSNNNKKSK